MSVEVHKVVRVDRSPLNPARWCLTLDCGCEEWVTASRKPKRISTIHLCSRPTDVPRDEHGNRVPSGHLDD